MPVSRSFIFSVRAEMVSAGLAPTADGRIEPSATRDFLFQDSPKFSLLADLHPHLDYWLGCIPRVDVSYVAFENHLQTGNITSNTAIYFLK